MVFFDEKCQRATILLLLYQFYNYPTTTTLYGIYSTVEPFDPPTQNTIIDSIAQKLDSRKFDKFDEWLAS